MPELNQQQINKKKAERLLAQRILKDKAMYVVSLGALPVILLCILALIFSAMHLEAESLAVISGVVSSVVISLITILSSLSGADKPDPLVEICKDLISHMMEDSSKEIILDDKSVRIQNKHSKMVSGNGDLIWGKDKKPKK
tara:strand:+ start:5483 stop:5905 length:423 start_codon:yes stop_codon:yes gene_type:complete